MNHQRARLLCVVAMMVVMAIIGCTDDPVGNDRRPPRQLTNAEKAVAEGGSTFGIELFKEVRAESPNDNLFISPTSVYYALGMALNGAGGTTQAAIQSTLALSDWSLPDVNESYRDLTDLLVSIDPLVDFSIANSVWYKQGITVRDSFRNVNRDYFSAAVEELDFADPGAASIINQWVYEHTQGLIPSIVASPLPESDVMYLINAIYFKGDWASRFDPADTSEQGFANDDGTIGICELMSQTGRFYWADFETFQVIDLPYGDGYFSMTVFLPHDGHTLDDLITQLDAASYLQWLGAFTVAYGDLYLPKFQLEYATSLVDALAAMGMSEAFTPETADFSNITELALFITDVRHKSFIQVDEEGTEAAAATSVGLEPTSAPPTFHFRADHPFLFMIREEHSGSLLFVGQVTTMGSE